MMKQIEETAARFQPITLDEMSGIRLMNRTDTKFVASTAQLLKLLEMAEADYLAQEIDGRRLMDYATLYFDTPDYTFYTLHHDGHTHRQKVRVRSYVDSRLSFLEVKTKDNHGRTHKKRIGADAMANEWTDALSADDTRTDFLQHNVGVQPSLLDAKVENRFLRLTLVNRAKTERLTIDTELTFHNLQTGRSLKLDGLAIVELKRDGRKESPILEMLRRLHVHPCGFSKYCMGLALTDPTLRQNRFKPRLHNVMRIANAN